MPELELLSSFPSLSLPPYTNKAQRGRLKAIRQVGERVTTCLSFTLKPLQVGEIPLEIKNLTLSLIFCPSAQRVPGHTYFSLAKAVYGILLGMGAVAQTPWAQVLVL